MSWPGARGHHEEPLSHCPRRDFARHRQHAGGHEQRLQEHLASMVLADVQHTAPSSVLNPGWRRSRNSDAAARKRDYAIAGR